MCLCGGEDGLGRMGWGLGGYWDSEVTILARFDQYQTAEEVMKVKGNFANNLL